MVVGTDRVNREREMGVFNMYLEGKFDRTSYCNGFG